MHSSIGQHSHKVAIKPSIQAFDVSGWHAFLQHSILEQQAIEPW